MSNADSVTQAEIDDAASKQYALAELFWYQLDKPDTAIVVMQNLLDSMSTSRIAPRAMLALSAMVREQRADTAAADSIVKAIPGRFPHSDYLPEIFEVLGLRGTPADTGYAEVYIKKAETFWVDEKNYDSARYWYQYVVDHFPQSAHYDRARFALIWLTESFQNPGDSSVFLAYQEFADSFPQSPFAADARSKLVVTAPVRHEEEMGPLPEDSTMLAQEQPVDSLVPLSTDSAGVPTAYFDPEQAVYYRGNDTLVLLADPPIKVEIPFEFPQEAYNIDKDRFILNFQVLLEFTGKVKECKLYNTSGNAEIDRRATQAMETSWFNTMRIRVENLEKWQVYKMLIEKPTELR